jgi:hypothetical protein
LTLGNGFPPIQRSTPTSPEIGRDRPVPYPETGLLPGRGAQIDQLCTAADLPDLDLGTAQIGGSRAVCGDVL